MLSKNANSNYFSRKKKYPTTAHISYQKHKLSSLLHLNYHLILKLIEAEFSPPTFLSAAHFCSLLINFSYHNIISHSLNSCSFSVVYFHFLLHYFFLLLCDIISFSKYVQHVYQSEHTQKKNESRECEKWQVTEGNIKEGITTEKKASAKRKQEEE